MKGTLKKLFLTVEINLILWLIAFGMIMKSDEDVSGLKTVIIVGVVFAAIVQHWAYYAAYKRAKQM
jgi:hypothetical protein